MTSATSWEPPTPPALSDAERAHLHTTIHRGHTNARTRLRAQVLLKLSAGWSHGEIRAAFDVGESTVRRVRARFEQGGVEAVLSERVQERRRQALTGEQQAHLVALACSRAPEGHDHWTLRLLAGQAVELGFVPSISPETIRALLKKTRSSPGSTGNGVSRRSGRSS